jgi:hypothetical protein
MKDQERTSPIMTLTKKKSKHQVSCHTERHFYYKCGEQGHLKKVCNVVKIPKLGNAFHSYSFRRPKSYSCARTMISSPRPSRKAIWVPKSEDTFSCRGGASSELARRGARHRCRGRRERMCRRRLGSGCCVASAERASCGGDERSRLTRCRTSIWLKQWRQPTSCILHSRDLVTLFYVVKFYETYDIIG